MSTFGFTEIQISLELKQATYQKDKPTFYYLVKNCNFNIFQYNSQKKKHLHGSGEVYHSNRQACA